MAVGIVALENIYRKNVLLRREFHLIGCHVNFAKAEVFYFIHHLVTQFSNGLILVLSFLGFWLGVSCFEAF